MRIQIVAVASAVVVTCSSTCALAQPSPAAPPPATNSAIATPAAAPAPATPSAAPAARVASGSLIVIEINELVSTKIQKKGDMFALKLAEAITYHGREIIPAGTPGMGQIIDTAPPGFGGAPAKLVLAARYLEFNGAHVPIHAMKLGGQGEDRDRIAMAVSGLPYVGLASIFIHGGQMELPPGSRALAKLGVDLPVPDALVADPPAPDASVAKPTAAPAPDPATTPPAAPAGPTQPQTPPAPQGKQP